MARGWWEFSNPVHVKLSFMGCGLGVEVLGACVKWY